MKTVVEELGGMKYRLTAEAGDEEYRKERNRIARQYASAVNIKGFRPGKAPIEMVIRTLGEALDSEVREHLVDESIRACLDERKLRPSMKPEVVHRDPTPACPLAFTAEFEAFPVVEPKDYLGIQVEEPELPPITDTDIDAGLERLRKLAEHLEPKPEDSVACEGDFAKIEYVIADPDTGEVLDRVDGDAVKVGFEDRPVKDFGRELLGMKAGEEKAVTGEWLRRAAPAPAEGEASEAAPRNVRVQVKVNEILVTVVPEIDEEFAKKYGGGISLAEWRERIKARLESGRARTLKNMLSDRIIDALVVANPIQLGEETVSRLASAAEEMAREQLLRGVPEEVRAKFSLEEAGVPRAETLAQARRDLSKNILLDAIGEKEGIEVSPEEVEETLAELAESESVPLPKLRARLGTDWGISLIRRLRMQKTMDLLSRYAVAVPKGTESVDDQPVVAEAGEGATAAAEVAAAPAVEEQP